MSNYHLAHSLHSLFAYAIRSKRGDAMKNLNAGLAAVVMAAGLTALAQTQGVQSPSQAAPAAAQSTRLIVVSLEDRKLALVENGQVTKVYAVAVGKPSTPSPAGEFTIERRVMNPTYHHDGRTVPPGPHNPVGDRWMGLSKAGYGIHGTNEPSSIGKAASHGCIRMGKADIEDLYSRVDVGDQVEIVGQPNEETARLFGAPQTAPAAQSQPAMVLAKANSPAPAAAATAPSSGGAIAAASPETISEAATTTLLRAGSVVSGLVVTGIL
jgi:lipoprotein-anchoring transpeptidase ErfK/SrfK